MDGPKFIDLCSNEGAADHILVAVALVLNNPVQPSLFPDVWVIVTNDKEVTAKAKEFPSGLALPRFWPTPSTPRQGLAARCTSRRGFQ